jgi:hypothetical protein
MRLLLLCFSLVSAATSLFGAACVSAPLSTYTVLGFTCEVGTAVFSDFEFQLQNAGGGGILDEDDITVSPLIAVGTVGLRFAADFTSTGGPNGAGPAEGIRVNEYRFFFDVTRPGSVLTSVGAIMNDPDRLAPNPLKIGNIIASNYAANDAALAIADDDDADLTDFDTLNSERVLVNADTMIHLAAGASAAGTTTPVGTASLSSADFLFTYRELDSPVPEPGTWVLSLSSLAALLVYRRLRPGARC